MAEFSRRKVVQLAAGLAFGAGITATGSHSLSAKDSKPQGKKEPPNKFSELETAASQLETYMFAEEVVFETPAGGKGTQYLEISPVRHRLGKESRVLVPVAAMRLVMLDAGDDSAKQSGALTWKCGEQSGEIKFKEMGRPILVMRDSEGTVRCYRLEFDLRC